ncbi:MAG: hypothetical protein IT329_07465 [Caldilineaceae bacterium]|nr:hypothetical protein [Caldilineaceae bacterium]
MTRPNRQLIRLYFIAVILMGLFGFWYAATHWQVETAALQEVNLGGSGDWVDFIATLGEEAIQLFLGFTSGQ